MAPRALVRSAAAPLALLLVTTAVATPSGSGRRAASTTDAAIRASAPARSGFADSNWGDAQADAVATNSYGDNAASKDPGSLFTVETATGARNVWNQKDRSRNPDTGRGVGIALLDSGVAPVPGLDAPGKVVNGPDLSIEGNGVLADQDTYGHGTFMAGLIAGRRTSIPSKDLASAPPSVQVGLAPDATLLSLKLATTDGSADVTQVIAAIDWVTEHPLLPDGTRVRVINLSYGTDSTQGYQVDPLAAAAENAWQHGIVVVTSAGNEGTSTGQLTDPGYDPYVIAVGAADAGDQVNGWRADRTEPAAFSNVSTTRHVDLLAPGTSLVSLRDPDSFIDVNNPQGLVSGDTSQSLFRGSGTSQAAAVVSGAVADLLQAYPTLTPDQIKYALVASADTIDDATAASSGAGILDVDGAYNLAGRLAGTDRTATQLRTAAVQSYPHSTGQGSIDAARGGALLLDADGNPINGEVDAQGNLWNSAVWFAASTSLTAWSGGSWMGSTWTGDGWSTDSGLTSARWSSARWSSARWSDADWSSARWSADGWSSARWSSARWSSARWSTDGWMSIDW